MKTAEFHVRSKTRNLRTSCVGVVLATLVSLALAQHGILANHGCLGDDPVDSPGCWKHRPDAELQTLLKGTTAHPFALPVVCGQTIDTPAEAKTILATSGSAPGTRFKRIALAMIFNIRRSILYGDGLLGDEALACLCVSDLCIVLKCGSFMIPDTSTSNPSDAISITQWTPLHLVIEYGNQLCALSSCPLTNSSTCGKTIGAIASALDTAINCYHRKGNCGVCKSDHIAPKINCPRGPLEFECTGQCGGPIHYTVTATDNCDPNPMICCYPPPGTVLPTGSRREVKCVAKDNRGNSDDCKFWVKVVDTTPPVICCPHGPIVVDCVVGGPGHGAVVRYPPATAWDLCDEHPKVTCEPPSGSVFPFGVSTVKCTAVDDSGNTSVCTFNVEVVESTPPTLTCPGDITVECTGPDGTVVTFPPPMVSSTCDPPVSVTCLPPSGSTFPVGETTVHCTARTKSGKLLSCSFKVTVKDSVPPVILCPGDMLFECSSPDGTPVSFAPSATDTCDANPTMTCDPPSGSLFPVGDTLVTCTASDSEGNTSKCMFIVMVRDTTPPDLSCPAGPILADCTMFDPFPGAVVNYPEPAASDSCGGVTVICTPPSGSIFPLGSTTVICKATDAAGNTSQCEVEVRVVDSAPPVLTCPGEVTAECTSPAGANVEYPPPVVADICDGSPAVTCEPPSGSFFPMGPTTVTCTAKDASGNVIRCEFTVTVHDTMPPQIACPSDKIVECEGPGGTRVEYQIGASDNCDEAPVLTCDPPSGSLFPVGLTAVHCTAVDASGNESVCTFMVHVVDRTPPKITCPDPIQAECQSPDGTPVAFSVSAEDVCSEDVTLDCTPPSGSSFLPGTTIVTCVATDPSGNESRCEFTVTVADTQPPTLSCPSDVIQIPCNGQNSAPAAYPEPGVSDLCDTDPKVVCDPPQGTLLSLGLHTVTCVATDMAGNASRCEFSIEVVDDALPALNCPQDITQECEGPDGARVTYEKPTPTDSCDPAPSLACLPPSGSVFPMGVTTVICTADDAAGNMVQCSFKVRVVDTFPPAIQCPGDIAAACTSADGTPVTFTVTAVDLCDPSPTMTCVPPSGSRFPLGVTSVTCRAVDHDGNASECSFNVVVRDSMPPELTCPDGFETDCIDGGGAIVRYPVPHASDDCDPNPIVVCDPPSGTKLPRGPQVIRCTATDASGNSTSCEFTVNVVDRAAPMLVCPSERVVECSSPNGTPVDYSIPVATDACDAQPIVTCVPPPGSLFPLGQSEVVCSARDRDGNAIQCTFIVRVEDRTPPALSCPAELTVDCASDEGAAVSFVVTATDNCDPSPKVECSPVSGSLFPLGRSTVTCTATDANGNASECSFTVNVVDRTPPALQCPPDIIVEGTTSGTAPHKPPGWPPGHTPPPNAITAAVVYDKPTASDACQTGEVVVTCDPPIGTRLELGTHVITCKARDAAGNEATCMFQITVELGERAFIRADANSDGNLDIGDPIFLVNFLFLGGLPLKCDDSADSNDDGRLDIADTIYSLGYIFLGGPAPPPPFRPLCGLDPTNDSLGCKRYLPCE